MYCNIISKNFENVHYLSTKIGNGRFEKKRKCHKHEYEYVN